jgi:sugar phosphate isomerase/epimerase
MHTLVVYRPTAHADEALQGVCSAAREHGGRVTVLALAAEERPSRLCCDTRSVLWNRVCRDLARESLARAAHVAGPHPGVEFAVLVAQVGKAVDTLAHEASRRDADEIVLLDPRASGLTRLELRRLRRTSPIPVSA